jgi:hypothetical protein
MPGKNPTRRSRPPVIYPDSLRPPPVLPDAQSVRDMGLKLSEQETTVIRMAMAIHTAAKQPKLTWTGWRHIATALAIGSEHAKRASDGRMDSPLYRRVMTEFLRKTGFAFINKDDRAAAVRLLPRWDEIDAWRSSLPLPKQAALNNPRETWAAYLDHRRKLGDPDAKPRPAERKHRQFPTLVEQYEAALEQLELARERLDRAEQQTNYFAELATAVALRAKLSDEVIEQIRARVRAAHEIAAETPETEDDQD